MGDREKVEEWVVWVITELGGRRALLEWAEDNVDKFMELALLILGRGDDD